MPPPRFSLCDAQYCFVPANVRDAYLAYIVRGILAGGERAIVFTSTCRACEELSCTLRALGIDSAPLHSQQPQPKRLAALGRFKQGTLKLLVATDVAARGIDIPKVGCVVNHNVPALPRDFIHRCGRTARAGRGGRAITLASQYDVEVLLAIEAAIGRKMVANEPNEADVLDSLPEVATARRTAVLELTENGFLEREKERRAERKEARQLNADAGEDDDQDQGEEAASKDNDDDDDESEQDSGNGDDDEAGPVAAEQLLKKKAKRKEQREREARGAGKSGKGSAGARQDRGSAPRSSTYSSKEKKRKRSGA